VDLSAVEYLDSSALALVHRLAVRFREEGRPFRIVADDQAFVRRVLLVTAMDGVVPIDVDVDIAVDAVLSSGEPG
jgi:anti-anti-sigma factor